LRWLPFVAAGLALLGPPLAARAEEAADAGAGEVAAEDRIVITGRPGEKWVEPPQRRFAESAVETEILTEADLKRLPATNVAEAIKNLPGIRIQQRVQGEGAALSIEGMPPSYTLILVNGQRYGIDNDGVTDVSDIPLANIERIEIRRGAQGLRYGPEAGGGVIDIITKDPPAEGWRFDADVGAGDAENVQAQATGGIAAGPVGVSLSFDHDQIAGFDSPDDPRGRVAISTGEDSFQVARDLYGTLRWDPRLDMTLRTRAGWRLGNEDLVVPGDEDETENRDQTRWLVSQELDWYPGDAARINGAFTFFDGTTDTEVGREFLLRENEYRLDLAGDYFLRFGPVGTDVTLGFDLRRTAMDLQEGEFPPEIENDELVPADLQENAGWAGVFALSNTEWTRWLTSEVGVRGQFHTQFAPALVPQAALVFTPWRDGEGRTLEIRLSAGRNYRIPSLRELYQPPAPQRGGGYFLEGNPDLETETGTSYRASLQATPVPWLTTSLVGFWNDIDDHIRSAAQDGGILVARDVTPPNAGLCNLGRLFGLPELLVWCEEQIQETRSPLYRKTNLDNVVTRGFEVRLGLHPRRWLDAEVGYTFLDTVVEDSDVDIDELPNEPPHVVDTRVTLIAPVLDTELTVRSRWRAKALMETSGTGVLTFATNEYSDPSVTIDLRLVQPVFKRFAIYADLYNVTDERFVDSYIVRGRSFLVGVRAHFD
jgi:outer membrane receptor for ferrienterochelin and colicin